MPRRRNAAVSKCGVFADCAEREWPVARRCARVSECGREAARASWLRLGRVTPARGSGVATRLRAACVGRSTGPVLWCGRGCTGFRAIPNAGRHVAASSETAAVRRANSNFPLITKAAEVSRSTTELSKTSGRCIQREVTLRVHCMVNHATSVWATMRDMRASE